GGGAGDLVGGVHVRVPDELVPTGPVVAGVVGSSLVVAGPVSFGPVPTGVVVAGADQQVHGRGLAAVADVQHDVLGQRVRAVGVTGRPGQRQDLGDLLRGQVIGTANGHAATVPATTPGTAGQAPGRAAAPACRPAAIWPRAPRTCTRPGGPCRSSTRTRCRAWRAAGGRVRRPCGYRRSSRSPTPRAVAGRG